MNVHMRAEAHNITPLLAIAIEGLIMRVKGRIVTPEQPDYDELRSLSLSNWDQRPLFVARVADAADVANVVDFARRHQLELAIRSGGHSVCGHSATDGGVVIDLRDLQSLDIDLDGMSVWAGSGLTAGQVSAALDEHGVAVGFGDSASVGISGLTLGGGVGYLTRKFGLTIDSLIAAEIVTHSGSILTIDESKHPELFWAIRGGGGNFGVVTRFRYRLNPLPHFTGGPLVLPATPEVLAGFAEAAKAAPDELSTILMAMPAPPLPFLPPELYGKTVLMSMMAFAGPAEDAQQALAPFRALATPLADLVRPGPYSMMYMPEDPSMKPALSVRTLFKDGLDLAEAKAILDHVARCAAPMRMAQVRVLGGAVKRVPAQATAYGHRDAEMLIAFLAMDRDGEAAARNDIWAEDCVASLGGSDGSAYSNFLADNGPQTARSAYTAGIWQRLREVKRSYDPMNFFRRNHNIPPA